MHLSGLLPLLQNTSSYRTALESARSETAGTHLALGVLRAARPYTLAALAKDWGAPVIYITARVDRAYNVSEQLPVWLGEDVTIHRFGEPAPFFYERVPWGDTAARSRLEALSALMPPDDLASAQVERAAPLVVTSARAIMQRTMPVKLFRDRTMILQPGQRWSIDKLLDAWVKMGYEPESMVVEPGKFSRRGGILDIFPTASADPIRIEFFDDEIDSLRRFNPVNQRSTDRLSRAVITPAREALPEYAPPLGAHLASWFNSLPPTEAEPTSPQVDGLSLATGVAFPYIEHYLPYLYPNPVSLLDYAPMDALIVVEDWAELRDTIRDIQEQAEKTRAELLSQNRLAPDHPQPYLSWEMLDEALRERKVIHMGGAEHDEDEAAEHLRAILAPEQRFGGQLKPFLIHLRKLRDTGDRAVIVTEQINRMTELWREQDSAFVAQLPNIDETPDPGSVIFVNGAMQEGWKLRADNGETHLFTDAEIFGWSRPEPRRRRGTRRAQTPEIAYADLKEGDFVVHVDYGVGRFAGMRRRTLEDVEREYLVVEYAGTDTLFVPIHQTDRLTRYVGPDDRPPTLSKLGQADWVKIKSRAKKAVEEEAQELLELYAARASAPGHRYAPDTPWQAEMEAMFPFVETEDQLRAVREVKLDMEKPHPMDRLICGDVGYGKTEVALRAAFKAVMDGKQVALLVPTTILAQQHYDTFSQRLAPFPIKVELLSRFRTKEQQNAALAKLRAGEVDIIIGTHRLLSDDVTLKDLGLVIIDEEQRFGVKHKEHLKRLRTQVDVLTMTATPIPRTLYMSLTGVRDISMIQTPPEDRMPIITHVGPFNDGLVRQAVLRELERGGQVFVVHNRVHTIEAVRERIENIVPEARVVVGHGQMDGRHLENVMAAFANNEYDILVATSIIESGLDIPNANTLIVDRADLFGLAQLYQIRGRVGRSAQQAYAYFFHPPANRLTEEARARLETLAEYTGLGSGYQIAMRDLELRGAGDILSTRQTGHVAAIGLHLYTQMLAQAVRGLKQEQKLDGNLPPAPSISESSVLIDLPMAAYLPQDYIPDMSQRLQIYRHIGGLTAISEVAGMREELTDRFGQPPVAVEGMLYQIEVKLRAQAANATAVLYRDGKFEIRLPYLVEINREALERQLGEDVRVTRTAVELLVDTEHDWRDRLLDVLAQLGEQVRSVRTMVGI
jgi:transcription-repair coupling factor (superfamily II helicase)